MPTPENQALTESIRELFAAVLMIPVENVRNNSDFVRDLQGDSFTYCELVAQLEERFGFAMPPEKYARCTTVADFVRLIQKKDG